MPTSAERCATGRVAWERSEDGFIAYPEGRDRTDHAAVIGRNGAHVPDPARWHWSVRYGEVTDGGNSLNSQASADAATRAWPKVKAEAERLAAEAAIDADLRRRIDKANVDGEVDIKGFGLEHIDRRHLLLLIGECRAQWEPAFKTGREVAGIETLMNAISEELFRRRVG